MIARGSAVKWVKPGLRALPAASLLLAFAHLIRGGFRGLERLGWWEVAILIVLLCGIGMSAARQARRVATGATRLLRDDLELGGGLIAAVYVVVAIGGTELFPIVYLLMAFLVGFLPRTAAITLLGGAVAFDALMSLDLPGSMLGRVIPHAAFLILFAVLYHIVLTTRLAAVKRAEEEAVRKRIREMEERARTFRLVNAEAKPGEPSAANHDKWLLASVKEIEGTLGTALEIADIALRSHSCAAFLLSSDDQSLKLYDCRSASEHIQREKFPAGEGILGGVIKRKTPVRMQASSGLKGVSHYREGHETICSLLAVPILEGEGLIRGVLVADRTQDEPFSDRDEKLLTAASTEVLRAIEVERVMGYIRKTRDEKTRFFRAIEELNRSGSPEEVFAAAMDSLQQLAELDFCAITLVREQSGARVHRIAKIGGATGAGKALEGKTFVDNNGLVANVVRYGTPLPGRELQAMDRQVIFDSESRVRGLAALKIFPLSAGERILGTLIAGSRAKTDFNSDVLRMIEVIALQAAQALLRAQLFEQTEKMAVTDGLTGLLNHRAFQARAEDALAQAKRYRRRCSLVLLDIDHFKSVNDTYGHPVGDEVLRVVARIIKGKGRDTDITARYGGEEFAIVMPETDARGAKVIAERIRETVGKETFATELGVLRITVSLGIATFPDHAPEKQALIDLADRCLYSAKHGGRNRSVSVAEMGKDVAMRAAPAEDGRPSPPI